MSLNLEETLMALLETLEPGASINPNQVAQFFNNQANTDPQRWRRELGKVRAIALGLARQGKIEILRKGKPIDPQDLKGIYRLRLPLSSPKA